MKILFPVPSTRHPIGGVAVTYEFAIALANRGHEVTLCHHELWGGDEIKGLDEVGWFSFPDNLHHVFVPSGVHNLVDLPDADIFMGHSPVLDDKRTGLPMKFIQGRKIYTEEDERAAYQEKCPKVCVAKWLIRAGQEDFGVPANELVHVPLGLHHDKFHLKTPIEQRAPKVLFCYNAHPGKGAGVALATLRKLHDARPDVEILGFGSLAPETPLPEWITYDQNPSQETLVDDLYNQASIFLWTSPIEGFGLPPLEAMTCGTAVVTTDNGGSEDYAFHGETALVSPPGDVESLTNDVLTLLDDVPKRQSMAAAAAALGATFTWENSAQKMEAFFEDYLRDPIAYGRPANGNG